MPPAPSAARFVRALMDGARFAQGLLEPPEPIVTGHAVADSLDVQSHPMENTCVEKAVGFARNPPAKLGELGQGS